MLDISLRPLKDKIFDPLTATIPSFVTPLQLTGLAFLSGIASCIAAAYERPAQALTFWLLNRVLDCLDGALARRRNQSSDLGGFLDLLSDFVVYSAIPICCTLGLPTPVVLHTSFSGAELQRRWLAVSIAEASFHVNNFVLFFVAAVTERKKAERAVAAAGKGVAKGKDDEDVKVKELTSVSMRPALVEGTESGVIFTLMLAYPPWTEALCWLMSAGVAIGIAQRVSWTIRALSK